MKFSKKLMILFSIFWVGCSTRTPVGPVHMSGKTYYCRGTWHHPQDYYEYDEVGIASWYGDGFHGKAKASGEKFNKLAMTAAHKTLPIPSVVKVTSYVTGKSVIVVVDDRGPFVYKGRIIDLSYSAAKALGIHRFKPSQVRVQTLVADSLKLSQYIAYKCKNKRDPHGRTWAELYFQEIKGWNKGMYTEQKIASQNPKVAHAGYNESTPPRKKTRHKSLGSYLNNL